MDETPFTHAPLAGNHEAMIAGTLCLMSCYAQHPAALYAERIIDNLTRLAGAAQLSPELRAVCRRLAERWEALGHDARNRADRGEPVPDTRAFH